MGEDRSPLLQRPGFSMKSLMGRDDRAPYLSFSFSTKSLMEEDRSLSSSRSQIFHEVLNWRDQIRVLSLSFGSTMGARTTLVYFKQSRVMTRGASFYAGLGPSRSLGSAISLRNHRLYE
jgi:hypothetical protein